jgi:hypothetical protein
MGVDRPGWGWNRARMGAILSLTGAFNDDTEGTAELLSLVYGVPLFAALWAAAVGAGYLLRGTWGKRGPKWGSR